MVGQYKESWLKLEEALGGRTALKGTPEELREQFTNLLTMLAPLYPPPTDAVSTQDGDVDGIAYRIYTPKEAAKSGPLPVGLYTHGGGFVVGNLDAEDALCRAVVEHCGCILVSVDYRLAPEHKAPAQLTDSLNVLKWARKNASSYGGDDSKFFTIGGSAGGGLALSVASRLVSNPSTKSFIRGIVAIVPLTLHPENVPAEYAADYKAYTENASNVPIIDKESMQQFYEYTGVDPADKSYFTLLDKDNLKNFPPTYICTCEFDPLRDDGQVLAKTLAANGVSVKTDYYEGFPHYFWIFPQVPEGQEFMMNTIQGVKWVLGQL